MCAFLWPHHPHHIAVNNTDPLPPTPEGNFLKRRTDFLSSLLPFLFPSFSEDLTQLLWILGFYHRTTLLSLRFLRQSGPTWPSTLDIDPPASISWRMPGLCHHAWQEPRINCFFIYVYVTLCVWRSRNNFKKLVLFFQHVSPRDQTHVIRLKNCLYQSSHCHGPRNNFLIACLFNPII